MVNTTFIERPPPINKVVNTNIASVLDDIGIYKRMVSVNTLATLVFTTLLVGGGRSMKVGFTVFSVPIDDLSLAST